MKTVGHEKYNNQFMSDNTIDCLIVAKSWIETYGYSPLYSEISDQTGLTLKQVRRAMNNLDRLGMITYTRERARGYVVSAAGQLFSPPERVTRVQKKHMIWGHHELTDIELEIMRSINTLFSAYRVPPSLTELCDRGGLTSTAHGAYILKRLREKGYIKWNPIVISSGAPNQFKKVIERTEKGVKVGEEWNIVSVT